MRFEFEGTKYCIRDTNVGFISIGPVGLNGVFKQLRIGMPNTTKAETIVLQSNTKEQNTLLEIIYKQMLPRIDL